MSIITVFLNIYYWYLLYVFSTYRFSASCGLIAPKMDKLAVGFSTAEIRLWGIGETVLIKSKARQTYVPFACDVSPFSKCNGQENAV